MPVVGTVYAEALLEDLLVDHLVQENVLSEAHKSLRVLVPAALVFQRALQNRGPNADLRTTPEARFGGTVPVAKRRLWAVKQDDRRHQRAPEEAHVPPLPARVEASYVLVARGMRVLKRVAEDLLAQLGVCRSG